MKNTARYIMWKLQRGANRVGLDRQVIFNDLSRVSAGGRKSRSRVLNLYSAGNNIGNFLPVLAIHQRLGEELDCWNIHDHNIDYDFINKSYESIIIGGAGLLHPVFRKFWSDFNDKCKVPFIIWGVGGCYPDNLGADYDPAIVGSEVFGDGAINAFAKADLINVRDTLTAELVGQRNVSVTACPTLMLLKDYRLSGSSISKGNIIYAPHSGLISHDENKKIADYLRRSGEDVFYTENEQSARLGLWDIVAKYKSSRLVVTSRLHGAITAWSLGVPFVSLSRDKKMDGFSELAGLSNVYRDVDVLLSNLEDVPVYNTDKHYSEVCDFADTAAKWVRRL